MNISLISWSYLGSLIVKNLRQPWHIHLPGHIRKSVHWINIYSFFMKNTIEQQNLQYENVAEFLKNICLIDVCVQHSRTINYSTVRSLPWKFGWIPWEILLHWICPAGISFIKHDLVQYAYMQKTCDVAEKAILAKKICGKSA